MKISKYQFNDEVLMNVTFDDYHEANEDAMAMYCVDGQQYIVICISALKEDDGSETYVVFKNLGFFKLEMEKNIEVIEKVLQMYEEDE